MGCRCSDIVSCEKEIRTLESSISPALSSASSYNTQISPALLQASQSLSEAINTDNLGGIEGLLSAVNTQMDSSIPKLISQCSSEISRLNGVLSNMRWEDNKYHEEQRRQAEAAAAAAAAGKNNGKR